MDRASRSFRKGGHILAPIPTHLPPVGTWPLIPRPPIQDLLRVELALKLNDLLDPIGQVHL